MNWKNFRIILPVAGSVAIVSLLFLRFDFHEVKQALASADIFLLSASATMLVIAQPILALRWKIALSLSGFTLSFRNTLSAYLANIPIAKLTPTYSGDFLRALYFKEQIPASVGAGIILLETLVDVCVLTLVAGFGALFMHSYAIAIVSILSFLGILCFCVLVCTEMVRTRMVKYPKVQNFFQALSIARSDLFGIFILTLLTLIAWLLLSLCFYFIFKATGESVPLSSVLMLQPLAVLFSLLPVTISGVGIRESGMLVLYAHLASATNILATGLAYSFFSVVVFPLICLPLTLRALRRFWRGNSVS